MTFKNYSEPGDIGYEVVREPKSISNIKPSVTEEFEPYRYHRTENGKLNPRLEKLHDWFLDREPENIVAALIRKHGGGL